MQYLIQRIIRKIKRTLRPRRTPPVRYPGSLGEVIDQYLRYYSERQFTQWGELFDIHAAVYGIKMTGEQWMMSIDDFVNLQFTFAQKASEFTERFENIKIDEYGSLAVIHADYILMTSDETRSGHDTFLLMKGPTGWRITTLMYEEFSRH